MSSLVVTPALFEHGSTWVRGDFHLHTIADKEFAYEGDPKFFVTEYIAALKKADIRVAVITNHNKFDRDELKVLTKNARKEEILVLSGLELSVKDGSNGIHILIVFSDAWISNQENVNYIQSFLNVTFAGQANFEHENGRSNHDLHETIRELDKFGKDYFLVCAHVEAKNGLWGGLSGGRIAEIGKSELFRQRCAAFQKVMTHDRRTQVKQQLGDWYPAEVEGCDCKSIDDIGKGKYTYIKIGAFTYEAVKFALLDYANRLSQTRPRHECSYIKSVEFQGQKLDGTKINFSPELNTFIGIRGSGKSTIIEALRYVLDIPFGGNVSDKKYKEESPKFALGSGGKITLRAVDRHNQEYEIRRIIDELPDVYFGGKPQPGVSIRETVLHKPIYFGQKDLSSTGAGFEKDLVEKLVGDKLADIRQNIATQRQSVVDITNRLRRLSDVGEKEKEYLARRQDAEHRLKVFAQYGVEGKLQKQVDFEQDDRTVRDLSAFVTSYIQELEDLAARHTDDFVTRPKYASKQNQAYFAEVFAIFERVSNGFNDLKKIVSQAKTASSELKAKLKQFDGMKNALKEEFAEIARKLSDELKSTGATAIKPDEFLRLRKAVEGASQMLKALSKEKEQQTALQTQLSTALTALNELWHEEFTVIKQELEKINAQETALQIEIDYKGDRTAFIAFLKDVFRGSKLRETTLTELAGNFVDGAALYRELEKARSLVGGSAPVFEEYLRENLSGLLTWQVPNMYAIKYHGKQLKHHSLGQRASALILFVLSQRENDVIIIDQPEDDLDNQTIYEDVIKLVRKLKPRTQFIFATHNPNIPVLGDAEQIIACAYTEDRIQSTVGSIDSPILQEAIVRIMEGGSEAFQRRKEIYEIWKQ
jgi:chromosome segregation protein